MKKVVPLALILASTLIALLLGEVLVRTVVNPGDFLFATLVEDPILGNRIKPHSTGHDSLGFRNREVPERVRIVAIGDSMTYGVSASREGSWPHQLAGLLKEPVYNMGLGGFGPLEYLYLAEHEAKKLQPRVLLVGFYFGNDLIDACRAAYQKAYWKEWRQASKNTCDDAEVQAGSTSRRKSFGALRDWLARHSVIYSMVRAELLPRLALWEQDRATASMTTEQQMLWVDPSNKAVRSIFTHQYRLALLDPESPRVQEGLRITKQAFARLKHFAEDQRVRLLLVLLPTKERAYCRHVSDSGLRMPTTFARLCEAEDDVRHDLVRFLREKEIQYVDVTVAMEEHVSRHEQIYPTGSDGHPVASGYGVVARAVYEAVRRQK